MQGCVVLLALANIVLSVAGQLATTGYAAPLQLSLQSQVYLPFAYDGEEPLYCYNQGAARAMSYQADENLVYVVGDNSLLQIVSISDVSNPGLVYRMSTNTPGTAIAACAGTVAVASLNFWNPAGDGNLLIYSQYDRETEKVTWRYNMTVGATPVDMVFTPDCSKLIIANQGFHGKDRGDFYSNPVGSVSVVDYMPLLEELTPDEAQALVSTYDFSQFDDAVEDLEEAGARWVYKGEFTPDSIGDEYLSHDLEPSSLVMSKDGSTVYIFMQKNNAVAVMDVESGEINALLPLGTKTIDHVIDASSVDGGVSMIEYNISALYQPSMVVPVEGSDGEMYLISSNTGLATDLNKDVNGVFSPFSDYVRGTQLADMYSGEVAEALLAEDRLGDMKFSTVDDGLVTFGARSFSVWALNNLTVLYDSGYFMEQRLKTHFLEAFNSMPAEGFCPFDAKYAELAETAEDIVEAIIAANTETVAVDSDELEESGEPGTEPETITKSIYSGPDAITKGVFDFQDHTSSSVGPQPGYIATATIRDAQVMILGTKGSSMLYVIDITDPMNPVWHSASKTGATDDSYYNMYQDQTLGDISPSAIEIVTGDDSPVEEPLVMVASGVSSALYFYTLAPAAIPDWMSGDTPSEPANYLVEGEADPIPATEEMKGRAKISDLTNGYCVDVLPDDSEFTCEDQRDFGKCDEAFMVERNLCAKACGRLPCNQGGEVELVAFLKNTTYVTVNPFLTEEDVEETLTNGVLSGFSCEGRSPMEHCLDLPAIFSALAGPISSEGHLSYITMADRGPNQDCGDLLDSGVASSVLTGKGFPVPNLAPYITKATVDTERMEVVVENVCTMKGTDGQPITGISNSIADDKPMSKDCKTLLDFDPSGLDAEDIYPIGESGLCLAVDEYSPSIFVLNCDFSDTQECGTVKMRYTPKGVTLDGAAYPVKDNLPSVYTQRRKNRGFESVAVSPKGNTAYVFVQSVLGSNAEGSYYRDSLVLRALELDISDPLNAEVVGEYLYLGDAPETWTVQSNFARDVKLSAALWLGEEDSDDVLVLERANGQVKLYVVNFAEATNIFDREESNTLFWEDVRNNYVIRDEIETVKKSLLLDSAQVKGWDNVIVTDKQEGVGIVNDCTVILGADNDFGLENNGPSTATIVRMQQCFSDLVTTSTSK
eukprot:TRINITY_DN273_c0_g2_i1.p1 TRINITY_DN273_c0_g2~~TRINITY_DN273_c0_g2_i1.p1  ORF type:complete len:1166 (+),score=206.27 TRINITY_DN273_c0_g2_i1:59-3556(+)